jgi:hypothetical protein
VLLGHSRAEIMRCNRLVIRICISASVVFDGLMEASLGPLGALQGMQSFASGVSVLKRRR